MACDEVRGWQDAVAFTLREGGFKGLDRGVCYSLTGAAPPLGLGEKPPASWEHVRGRWYSWAAE
jgi:hypothetical protein